MQRPEECRHVMLLQIFPINTPNLAVQLRLHLRTKSLPVAEEGEEHLLLASQNLPLSRYEPAEINRLKRYN